MITQTHTTDRAVNGQYFRGKKILQQQVNCHQNNVAELIDILKLSLMKPLGVLEINSSSCGQICNLLIKTLVFFRHLPA